MPLSDRDSAIFRKMISDLCSEDLCERLKKKTDELNVTPTNTVDTLEAPTNTVDTLEADLTEFFCPSSDQEISEFIKTPEKKS